MTEKGKKKAAARLDKLPTADYIFLNLAFCESHQIPVNLEVYKEDPHGNADH